MLNSLFIRSYRICILCLFGLISAGCREQPGGSTTDLVEPIKLGANEQVYEGFILSGAKGQVFVRGIKSLRRPGQLYWVEYDSTAFKDGQIGNEVRRAGEWISWPSCENQSRITWVKFIAREKEVPLKLERVAELDKGLIIEKVIRYSNEPAAEELGKEQ